MAKTRLLVITGPCSLHDPKSALEYGHRLADLATQLDDKIFIVMRAYVEKPRTTVGWKGMLYDPHLDGSNDIATGLNVSRHLLLDLARLGLPLATELLHPMAADYLGDLLSWAAIGARTTESQIHREMVSGLPCRWGSRTEPMAASAWPATPWGGHPPTRIWAWTSTATAPCCKPPATRTPTWCSAATTAPTTMPPACNAPPPHWRPRAATRD